MKFCSVPFQFLFVLLVVFSCAKRGTSTLSPGQTQYGPAVLDTTSVDVEDVPQSYGPELPPAAPSVVTEDVVPLPSAVSENAPQEPKLCLVLGPGMAKALAQAAVLEVIHKSGLPVHCVVGTEMGAVIGALYSMANGTTNSLQWQLFKFNRENYFNFPLISLREPKASGKKLHEELRDIFKNKRIEDLPIRFGTVAADLDKDVTVFFDSGDLSEALSASLAVPGVFEPWVVDNNKLSSGAMVSPAPLELAKKLGGNFFVLVDVISDGSSILKSDARFQRAFSPVKNLLKLQRRDANFVIDVNTGRIPFDDFGKQGEIFAIGLMAAEKMMPALMAAWEKRIALPK